MDGDEWLHVYEFHDDDDCVACFRCGDHGHPRGCFDCGKFSEPEEPPSREEIAKYQIAMAAEREQFGRKACVVQDLLSVHHRRTATWSEAKAWTRPFEGKDDPARHVAEWLDGGWNDPDEVWAFYRCGFETPEAACARLAALGTSLDEYNRDQKIRMTIYEFDLLERRDQCNVHQFIAEEQARRIEEERTRHPMRRTAGVKQESTIMRRLSPRMCNAGFARVWGAAAVAAALPRLSHAPDGAVLLVQDCAAEPADPDARLDVVIRDRGDTVAQHPELAALLPHNGHRAVASIGNRCLQVRSLEASGALGAIIGNVRPAL